jgi:LEA14-like dessication related protein
MAKVPPKVPVSGIKTSTRPRPGSWFIAEGTTVQINMSFSRLMLVLLPGVVMLPVGGCASLQPREPIQVFMVGMEPMQGQGLELRMLVKLRVQNPNDLALTFNGVSLAMDVQGKRFASGVSSTAGTVPTYGETIVEVPVSISMFNIARQAVGVMSDELPGKLSYEMTGTLGRPASMRFKSQGEIALPAGLPASDR